MNITWQFKKPLDVSVIKWLSDTWDKGASTLTITDSEVGTVFWVFRQAFRPWFIEDLYPQGELCPTELLMYYNASDGEFSLVPSSTCSPSSTTVVEFRILAPSTACISIFGLWTMLYLIYHCTFTMKTTVPLIIYTSCLGPEECKLTNAPYQMKTTILSYYNHNCLLGNILISMGWRQFCKASQTFLLS